MAFWDKLRARQPRKDDKRQAELDRDAEARFTNESGHEPQADAETRDRPGPGEDVLSPTTPANPADFTKDESSRTEAPI
ncbi:MAG: hypothetical protein JNG88_11630 [Phycisphaerales bacterium]|nr:hypothetical protein [Phycisphaerales bacterium]